MILSTFFIFRAIVKSTVLERLVFHDIPCAGDFDSLLNFPLCVETLKLFKVPVCELCGVV